MFSAPDSSKAQTSESNSSENKHPAQLPRQMSASVFFEEISQNSFFDVDLDDDDQPSTSTSTNFASRPKAILCSICLDRKADIILPCLHLYCCECIESWDKTDNENHDRCPQCRGKMSLKDNWVFFSASDTPSHLDVGEYLMEACDM